MDEFSNLENKGTEKIFDANEKVVTDIGQSNSPVMSNAPDTQNFGTVNHPHIDFQYQTTNPSKPPKKERKRFSFAALIAVALITALLGAGTGVGAYYLMDTANGTEEKTPSNNNSNNTTTVKTINVSENYDSLVQAVAEKASPSVVGIRTTAALQNFFGDDTSSTTGEGSGVIYTSDGYIITNYHVIEEAVQSSSSNTKIEVFLPNEPDDGIEAEVIGYNIASDLAVIKIEKDGLAVIELGDSDNLSVGQYCVAIGNPGGLEFMGSVSYGIISGLNRKLNIEGRGETSLIQTDAAINPGNSGGALLNSQGQLIGVNSAKISSTDFEGMGFAIPVNTVVQICNRIIEKKDSPTPYVGISINTQIDESMLKMMGYPAGTVVYSVTEDGPADQAGIQDRDIITKFNGKETSSYALFSSALNECDPGDRVEVEVFRNGKYLTLYLVLGANNI